MKLDNSEMKLIVDTFIKMRKAVTISIHGRMFFDILSSNGPKRVSVENNKIVLNINNGKMTIYDDDDVISTLTRLDKNLVKTTLEDFLWCNCLEFNVVTIEDYPDEKYSFWDTLLCEYMDFKKCKCFELYCLIEYKICKLIYFRDKTVYREYMDLDTDKAVPLLLIFETTIKDFIDRVPGLHIIGISPNYEVSEKFNYLKQLARVSRKVKFKFKVVSGK